jgi:hypothetical protein
MKIKQTLLSGLLIASAAMLAGEPALVLNRGNSEFLKNSSQLFPKKQNQRDFLKIKKSSILSSARDWDKEEMTSGGFFLNLGVYLPGRSYLIPPSYQPFVEPGDIRYGLGYDFEIGNFFRFAKINDGMMGIGLRATWLNFGMTSMVDEDDYLYVAMQISPLRVGPQFSYALNDMMAIDAFYQIGYNATIEIIEDDDLYVYSGLTHEVGAAFRYKVFSAGLGYRFGSLYSPDWEEYLPSNYLRIQLGFKF